VFIGAFRTQPVLAVLGVVGAALTAVYILRLLARVFFGPLSAQWERLPDLSAREGFAAAVLVVPIFLVGIYPAPFLRIINHGVEVVMKALPGA